jgi:hypothetical protein
MGENELVGYYNEWNCFYPYYSASALIGNRLYIWGYAGSGYIDGIYFEIAFCS